MNILQGLKLRWDLSICRGESGGEGLGGDTGAVATAVCLGVRGSLAWKPNHTGCVCEVSFENEKYSIWTPSFDYCFCDGLIVTFLHFNSGILWHVSGYMLKTCIECYPFHLHAWANLCACIHAEFLGVWCLFACACYGLVTGTCLHSSTARGRLSKNSLNPTGACVLSSILFPLWPRLERLEVEGCWADAVNGSRNCFTCMYTHTWACGTTLGPMDIPCCCWLESYTFVYEYKMHTGTYRKRDTYKLYKILR